MGYGQVMWDMNSTCQGGKLSNVWFHLPSCFQVYFPNRNNYVMKVSLSVEESLRQTRRRHDTIQTGFTLDPGYWIGSYWSMLSVVMVI